MSKELWIIVDMQDASDAVDGYYLPSDALFPSPVIYDIKDKAEDALLKLQEESPEAEFVLFQAVAEANPGLFHRGVLFVDYFEE